MGREPQEAMAALKKLADGKTYNIAIRHHQGRFDIMLQEISTSEVPVADETVLLNGEDECSTSIQQLQVNE